LIYKTLSCPHASKKDFGNGVISSKYCITPPGRLFSAGGRLYKIEQSDHRFAAIEHEVIRNACRQVGRVMTYVNKCSAKVRADFVEHGF
jgi:hypothetical protein